MKNLAAIVLAAGKGTRMRSALPKVLHPVSGKPMLFYPLSVLKELGASRVVVVVGHGSEEVCSAFDGGAGRAGGRLRSKLAPKLRFTTQEPQLGTGHAVICALKELKDIKGDVLILSGDVPLLTLRTVKALCKLHRKGSGNSRPVITFISAMLKDPAGYGRVVREEGTVASIVEDKDLSPSQRGICEINAGIYLVGSDFLRKNIKKLSTRNRQREYYLPDLVSLAYKAGRRVVALTHIDPEEVMGVNNRVELARASAIMRERVLTGLMLSGVTVTDPATTYVDYGVKVGRDSVIGPGVHLAGETSIGAGTQVEEGVKVLNSNIGPDTLIKSYSIVESSKVGRGVTLGPFARLRPGSVIKDRARVGNFVEVKNTELGSRSKANHLSYLGDATIGSDVNIGAGVITCNYDGVRKFKTVIKDNAFIGSDTQLIAPVTVGRGAYVGSGTTVTSDVPPGALAISRAEQKVVRGWAGKKKGKKVGKKKKG